MPSDAQMPITRSADQRVKLSAVMALRSGPDQHTNWSKWSLQLFGCPVCRAPLFSLNISPCTVRLGGCVTKFCADLLLHENTNISFKGTKSKLLTPDTQLCKETAKGSKIAVRRCLSEQWATIIRKAQAGSKLELPTAREVIRPFQ